MMKQSHSESGAVIEWLIFGVVIVGVSMLIAWRFVEADREQTEAQRALTNSSILRKSKTID